LGKYATVHTCRQRPELGDNAIVYRSNQQPNAFATHKRGLADDLLQFLRWRAPAAKYYGVLCGALCFHWIDQLRRPIARGNLRDYACTRTAVAKVESLHRQRDESSSVAGATTDHKGVGLYGKTIAHTVPRQRGTELVDTVLAEAPPCVNVLLDT
jgi:hypothetical protein